MIEKYDNLWLDTTMVITDYFPIEEKIALGHYVPYAWDRELKELKAAGISHEVLEKISYKNAADFFSLKLQPV